MATILLIEPDAKLAQVYADSLELSGYNVCIENTAQAAILAADKQKPDLVILEIQLTNHSGVEFLYEFRSYTDWRDVPVLIVSHVPEASFAGSQDLLHKRLGVQGYLYKPDLTLRDLTRAVEDTLAVA